MLEFLSLTDLEVLLDEESEIEPVKHSPLETDADFFELTDRTPRSLLLCVRQDPASFSALHDFEYLDALHALSLAA